MTGESVLVPSPFGMELRLAALGEPPSFSLKGDPLSDLPRLEGAGVFLPLYAAAAAYPRPLPGRGAWTGFLSEFQEVAKASNFGTAFENLLNGGADMLFAPFFLRGDGGGGGEARDPGPGRYKFLPRKFF